MWHTGLILNCSNKSLFVPKFIKKINNLSNFQLIKAKKYPKIISKNCFNANIQKISRSPMLYHLKSMTKWVLSPPPTIVHSKFSQVYDAYFLDIFSEPSRHSYS